MRNLPWINFFLGLWLVISPFVLGYGNIRAAMWNEVIVGVLVLTFASIVGASLNERATYRSEEQKRKAA